jgi:hypothetical protein
MSGRKFEDIEAKEWIQLKEILEIYAEHCGAVAKQLGENGSLYTDGYTAVKKGVFALRNMLGKQLGRLAVEEPKIVATWEVRRKKKATPVRINTAAESPAIYDLTQGNPSMKQQAKAIKAIDKKVTQEAKKKAKPSKPDNA